MLNQFSRTELIFGHDAMEKIYNSHVAIFGIGGVGGYAVEALARSGVKYLDLFDHDTISVTNINRQIIATTKTVGLFKVDVMKDRILEINPDAIVNTYKTFFLPENSNQYDFSNYDYVIDAIDTVSAKIELVLKAKASNVKIISAMGAGNKIDPTKFVVTDIFKTNTCPLARVMRTELKKRGIQNLKVVYSTEKPIELIQDENTKQEILKETKKRVVPGSNAFVPSTCGLIIASEVIKDLIKL